MSVVQFDHEELCAWLRESPLQFKNEEDMEAICDALRVNEIDGESFLDFAEHDIASLFPDGTKRFILRRKQVRDVISKLGKKVVTEPNPTERISVQPCSFMLVQTPGITEPEVHLKNLHHIVQDQVAVMLTVTQQLEPPRRPTAAELEEVARQLVRKYPGLAMKSEDPKDAHIHLLTKMKRRLSNITPVKDPRGPRKRQVDEVDVANLRRSPRKKKQVDQKTKGEDPQPGTSGEAKKVDQKTKGKDPQPGTSGEAKKVCKEAVSVRSDPENHPPEKQADHHETAYTMERHYKLLQAEMEKQRPKRDVVKHLLDLEFPARREYGTQITNHEGRAAGILQRYPCFGDAHHLQDELQRYVAPNDKTFLPRLKEKLVYEAETVVKYAIDQKLHKNTKMKDWEPGKKVRKALQLLPQLFKGTGKPPVPLRNMLIVMLKENDSVKEEGLKTKKRTAFLAVKQVEDDISNVQVFIMVHGKAIAVCRSVVEGFVSLIGALYCFQQPHPTSIAPAMVFVEHHMLQDRNVNLADLSFGFKRVYAKYVAFQKKTEKSDSESESE